MHASNNTSGPVLAFLTSFLAGLRTHAVWGHCYENCYRVFFAYPDLFEPDGTFVEGWVVFVSKTQVILVEHGWCVSVRLNKIIDPTLVLALAPDQEICYFPGVIRSWEETDKLENEFFPHVRFCEFGEDGMQHPGYKAAYESAREKAQSLLAEGHTLIEVKAGEVSIPGETISGYEGILIIQKGDGAPEIHTIRLPEE